MITQHSKVLLDQTKDLAKF